MNRNINFIPFSRPVLNEEEEDAVIRILRSGWLTTGQETQLFEQEFASYVGAEYALAVNSGTAGLHLSLEALKPHPGSVILTTPYTFTASAEVARYLGLDVQFVDIDEKSFNIDPNRLEEVIKKSKRSIGAVIPVHIAGLPCKMDELLKIQDQYNIPFIEDTAHAFPVTHKEKFVGTFGNTGVYSFYANKTITTGEGGMIVTNDPDLAKRIKIMRLHGIDRESWNRYVHPGASWYYEIVEAGYKYNLPDIASAIGRVQLRKAETFRKEREKIARFYIKELAACDYIQLPEEMQGHAWHLFMIRIHQNKLNLSRDEYIVKLQEADIGCSVHFIPLHIMPYYKKRYNLKPEDFPVALRNFNRTISLPIYPGLTARQLHHIVSSIKKIGCDHYKLVHT